MNTAEHPLAEGRSARHDDAPAGTGVQRLRGVGAGAGAGALAHGMTLLGAVAAVGLLLAFLQVVSGAVQQGDRLHAATARHGEATLRCRSQPNLHLRENCMAELDAASPRVVLLQAGELVEDTAR